MKVVARLLIHDRLFNHYLFKDGIIRLLTRFKGSSLPSQECFVGFKDRFNGITIESVKANCTQANLPKMLEESLNKWTSDGQRCIWFKVHIKDAFYVPILAQKGFNFHHARDDFVMMYKWLPGDSLPNLPPASHTNLGVGAMVFNNNDQILAVSENHYDYPHWKLPGGYVERGEDIIDAAIREVKEETGVDTSFLSLVTFRHSHKLMFGNSDIYVLLMMKALTDKITPSGREVRDCKWMKIEEYINHPNVHEFNRLVINKALEYKTKKLKLNIEKRTVKYATYEREINYLNVMDENYQ